MNSLYISLFLLYIGRSMSAFSQAALIFRDLTNQARASQGLPPICLNSKLTNAANAQSNFLFATRTFDHAGPGGNSPGDRALQNGFQWNLIEENIVSRDDTAKAFERLMASPPHQRNILNPRVKFMGLGGVPNVETFVQMFADSAVERCDDGSQVTETSLPQRAPAPPSPVVARVAEVKNRVLAKPIVASLLAKPSQAIIKPPPIPAPAPPAQCKATPPPPPPPSPPVQLCRAPVTPPPSPPGVFLFTTHLRNNEPTKHILSGAGAGCLTAIVTCPLEVLKTRLQSQNKITPKHLRYRGIFCTTLLFIVASLNRIWVEEGIRGMYKGLGPTILGYLPTWTVYFWTYDFAKHSFAEKLKLSTDHSLVHLLGAVTAGMASTIVTNPLWVIKTRMMTQYISKQHQYTSTLHAIITIAKQDGLKGFYRGILPSLAGVSHVAVQFPIYERLKSTKPLDHFFFHSENTEAASNLSLLFASMTSKLIASVTTYPHEVVRTRLQNESIPPKKYFSTLQTIQLMYKEEGLRGFYRGMATNLVRTVPASATINSCIIEPVQLIIALLTSLLLYYNVYVPFMKSLEKDTFALHNLLMIFWAITDKSNYSALAKSRGNSLNGSLKKGFPVRTVNKTAMSNILNSKVNFEESPNPTGMQSNSIFEESEENMQQDLPIPSNDKLDPPSNATTDSIAPEVIVSDSGNNVISLFGSPKRD